MTRTTEVRPELNRGTFKCLLCDSVVKDIEQQFKYTLPVKCSNANCANAQKFDLIPEDSAFSDWQKVRVQEHSGDIPAGSMPRSIDVILRHEVVDAAKPGDRCVFAGTLLAVPEVVSTLSP